MANLGPPTSKPRFGGAFFVGPEAHAAMQVPEAHAAMQVMQLGRQLMAPTRLWQPHLTSGSGSSLRGSL
jgi:hypothetical protein